MIITRISKLLLLTTIVFSTGCATYTSVREHASLAEVASDLDSVVVAPPQVNIELRVFTGENEPLTDKEDMVRDQLITLAEKRLQEEGLKVINFDFENAIANDEDLAFSLTQAKEALDHAKKDLYSGKAVAVEDKAQFRASLGPAVNAIAEHTGAETVLLMDYYGFEKSAGLKTKDAAAGILLAVLLGSSNAAISAPSGSFVDLALVDTASGDVLWTNRRGGQAVNALIAEHAFNEFPDVAWESEAVIPTMNTGMESTVADSENAAAKVIPASYDPDATTAEDTADTKAAIATQPINQ